MGQNNTSSKEFSDLNENSKIRFYHVPKNGGTTIFNMTKDWQNFKRGHSRENHVHIKDYPPEENETGMTVIRHPYNRFESAFYHMVDACNDKFYYRHASISDCDRMKQQGIIDFGAIFQNDPNEMLEALTNKHHPYHHEAQVIFNSFSIFRSQFHWLANKEGNNIHQGIKILLHQENLKREFEQVAKQLGHLPKWPDEFQSNKRITQSKKDLNNRSKMILQNLYEDDFKYFNFER